MRRNEVTTEYFSWLINFVGFERNNEVFSRLFEQLHSIIFTWSIELDENRAKDGIELRDRFMSEFNLPRDYIYELDGPCSVFEMMVALHLRCEETIMTDIQEQGFWFWKMIENMCLEDMSDNFFDDEYVSHRIGIMMERKYAYNGSNGGMFVIDNPRQDLRKTDIWYQFMWWLSENFYDDTWLN